MGLSGGGGSQTLADVARASLLWSRHDPAGFPPSRNQAGGVDAADGGPARGSGRAEEMKAASQRR
jgi:hypothetical protein